MNYARLTTHLKRPESLWQWLCLISLICLGWVSTEQLGAMFTEADEDDGTLLVYDANGNLVVYLPDHLAGRPIPDAPHVELDEVRLCELDLAMMKPSCCDAPEGLSHLWYLPKRIGRVLPFRRLRPALAHHPDLSITSSRT